MQIYMAGGVTGNLNAFWKEYMNIYLAGCYSRDYCLVQAMQKFLSHKGEIAKECEQVKEWEGLSILESFYYLQNNTTFPNLIKDFGSFLLDSGAFTFMSNSTTAVDFDKYVEDYAAFINKWGVERFFELDIDSVVGLKEVERLRFKLEQMTGKKPIPVWHRTRGKDYFLKMCDNYPYVAIGGIVTKEIERAKYEKLFPWFISTAHQNGSKIHGLGYTNLENMKRFRFDSVDSTTWKMCGRFGQLMQYDRGTIIKHNSVVGGVKKRKIINPASSYAHNFGEWLKFQKYADNNL